MRAESFRQCVDITSCPMQYAAVRQCHEEHGVEAPECADQARFYNHCLYAVEFANGASGGELPLRLTRLGQIWTQPDWGWR